MEERQGLGGKGGKVELELVELFLCSFYCLQKGLWGAGFGTNSFLLSGGCCPKVLAASAT